MLFSCSICCSELANSQYEISATPCHHVFHEECLNQWLAKSETCPQCRKRFHRQRPSRLFLTTMNDDGCLETPSQLQDKIRDLEYKSGLKNEELEAYRNENQKYKTRSEELRKDVGRLESREGEHKAAIIALQNQLKLKNGDLSEANKYKDEVKALKNKILLYKTIQQLLSSGVEEINKILANTSDTHSMSTYIFVLKKQLDLCISQRKDLKNKIQELTQDYRKIKRERDTLASQLKNLTPLDKDDVDDDDVGLVRKPSSLKKKIDKSKTILLNDSEDEEEEEKNVFVKNPMIVAKQNITISDSEDEENSQVFRLMGERKKIPRSSTIISPDSILRKRKRLSQQSTVNHTSTHDDRYTPNGIGGFKRVDTFPVSSSTGLKSKVVLPKRLKKF
ncbi:hypothetical protein HCN44_009772 [Aphidius gifuensis]|uniref:RING-type domain-containing protein n=1 Tax=Aphidius gifuensis TaxID=684658 RepID=A0A835CWI4_APHGI|nr:E3 ubiquitin-protein ligase trul-1 [Aphidius gifuensis]KAF7998374.1 hypothetical protein HCN44_009772 [Aphidius gifuensis]